MDGYNIHLDELNALDRYFEVLKKTGYYNYKDVNKLIVLDFIRELLSPNYNVYITNEDYNDISELLYCLFKSTCLLPYPVFIKNLSVIGKNYTDDDLRITDTDELFRLTNNDDFRIEV